MHGWTIWLATFFYNIDNWWNEFITLGTNYWYWNVCKTLTYIIILERLPSGMCHTVPYKGQKIHATTLIIITTFTWHYKRICNTLQNSTTWFTSCTHHSLGCKKWHWKYHKWNYCFYSCNIWWKKNKKFIQSTDGMQNTLYKIVMKKQLHTCGNRCVLNKSRNQ